MRILVTGGCGRIGRYVVRDLVQAGHEVTSVDLVRERVPGGRQVVLDQDSAELVRRHFGDQVEIRGGLVGRASPLNCARAEEAFGYRPQYDWSVHQRYPEKG